MTSKGRKYLVIISHIHSTVQHDILSTNSHKDAAVFNIFQITNVTLFAESRLNESSVVRFFRFNALENALKNISIAL